jgi:hypothetical protein
MRIKTKEKIMILPELGVLLGGSFETWGWAINLLKIKKKNLRE